MARNVPIGDTMTKFLDGLKSFTSSLINRRTATAENYIEADRLTDVALRNIYRTGLGNKIIRIKAGAALKDTLQFESTEDETYYTARLAQPVKAAARWMVAMGRGIIVLHAPGDDLARPLGKVDPVRTLLNVFSGDMVTVGDVVRELHSPRYYKPVQYIVRGFPIHYSRVIDFAYVAPPELDAPYYRYGGISEFELIHDQLIADGVVQRASPKLIDKASTLFYKVRGFREAMATGQESEMVSYFRGLEDVRGLLAAGLIDADDDVESISQSITNLADADQITLRRLAMVTGISVTRLIGEAPRGMNSTGEKEAEMDQDMLETLQSDYLLGPINELMRKLGQGAVEFKENQGETANGRMDYETKAITNAVQLATLGEDYGAYLMDKGVTQADEFDDLFDVFAEGGEPAPQGPEPTDPHGVDPTQALNGAQVTALLDVIAKVRTSEIDKGTAIKIIAAAFPLSVAEASDMLSSTVEGSAPADGIA